MWRNGAGPSIDHQLNESKFDNRYDCSRSRRSGHWMIKATHLISCWQLSPLVECHCSNNRTKNGTHCNSNTKGPGGGTRKMPLIDLNYQTRSVTNHHSCRDSGWWWGVSGWPPPLQPTGSGYTVPSGVHLWHALVQPCPISMRVRWLHKVKQWNLTRSLIISYLSQMPILPSTNW